MNLDLERNEPLTVFVSYSHADKGLKEELSLCLSGLKRQRRVALWVDNCIDPGGEIETAISSAMDKADIVLLLVSPNFIGSDYCYEKELDKALDMHRRGDCLVIPIIARPCDWLELPFGRLKALPEDGKPVTTWADRDSAWHDVAQAIRKSIYGRQLRNAPVPVERPDKIRAHLKTSFQQLSERYERRGELDGQHFSVGLEALDLVIGGVERGALVVFAGGHRSGHDGLLLNAVLGNARRKCDSLVISPRGNAVRTTMRLVSLLSWIPHERILTGELDEDDWPRITNAIALISEMKVHMDDTCATNVADVVARIIRYVDNDRVRIVFVDGLERFDTVEGGYREVVRALKDVAVTHQVAIMCSLTLDTLDDRKLGAIKIDALSNWRDLAHEADSIIFTQTDSDFGDHGVDRCRVELAKFMGASTSKIFEYCYDQATARFSVERNIK